MSDASRSPRPTSALRVRFWGVRGSTPTPVLDHMAVGGNTSCVELTTPGGTRLIFDAGTGLRLLGDCLLEEARQSGRSVRATILLSHLHWDHIQGFPFFRPAFVAGTEITIVGVSSARQTLEHAFRGQLKDPYFPVVFEKLPARVSFLDLTSKPLPLHDVVLRTCALHHPQGATGFRVDCNGRSVVYIADHEHGDTARDHDVRELAADADLLICDAQFTPEEYENTFRGWGHSTWIEVARLAQVARVKQLLLTHHDPWHNDAQMDAIEQAARGVFPATRVAREGMEILV
ncbi:MAG: MBL fold metallo-hydrolase [Terriglobales bacterium]